MAPGTHLLLLGAGGGLPIMVFMRMICPKVVPFAGFRYMKGLWILLVEVYERVGKSVIWVCETAQRAEQMNFMALES